MTLLVFCGVALAGGVGAATRLFVDGLLRSRVTGAVPWGTIVVNLTGSLVLGFLAGLAIGNVVPEEVHQIVGSGFLGGYTTFSTASFETVRLLQERRWAAGALNGLGVLVATTALAGIGLVLGALI